MFITFRYKKINKMKQNPSTKFLRRFNLKNLEQLNKPINNYPNTKHPKQNPSNHINQKTTNIPYIIQG